MSAKIKKGDKVVVITGKDKGMKSIVLAVFPKERRALVQGVNMIKRHTKPSKTTTGGIVSRESRIDLSNILIEDPKTGRPSRVGFKMLDNGNKIRISKASGETIDG
jgi:large subunit ribosomal protein L24